MLHPTGPAAALAPPGSGSAQGALDGAAQEVRTAWRSQAWAAGTARQKEAGLRTTARGGVSGAGLRPRGCRAAAPPSPGAVAPASPTLVPIAPVTGHRPTPGRRPQVLQDRPPSAWASQDVALETRFARYNGLRTG